MGVGSTNTADSFLSLLQMPESITLEREKDSFCLFVCFGSVFGSSQMIRYLLLLWAHDSMPPQGHVSQAKLFTAAKRRRKMERSRL